MGRFKIIIETENERNEEQKGKERGGGAVVWGVGRKGRRHKDIQKNVNNRKARCQGGHK